MYIILTSYLISPDKCLDSQMVLDQVGVFCNSTRSKSGWGIIGLTGGSPLSGPTEEFIP